MREERRERSARDRRSKQERAGTFGARSRETQGEVLGVVGREGNCEVECRVCHHRVGAARADVKVAGTAVLEVGMGNPMLRSCSALRHRMGGVTVRGEMQDTFHGFAGAAAQHDGCDGKEHDQKPLRH